MSKKINQDLDDSTTSYDANIKKQRCCAIAYTFYERDWRVRRYCEALAQNGFDVDMIALRSKDQEKFEILNGVRVFRIQERSFRKDSLISYLLDYMRFFIKGAIVLTYNHLKGFYKLIHVHNMPDFLVFMAIIPKIFGAKVVLDIHDILPEYYAQKFDTDIKSTPIQILLLMEKVSAKFSDFVITANDIWKDRVVERDGVKPDKIMAILNYPSLKYHQNDPVPEHGSDHEFRLVYPGTISWIHGIDILIEGVGFAKDQIPGIKLDIFCLEERVSVLEEHREKIREIGLENNIRFKKAMTPDKLAPILATYDAGVVPKRGGIFADEAFSSKIFDFMAAGLPVIASRTRIDEYYFDDSMILFFTPEDSRDLGSKIVKLHRDDKARERYKENYRQYLKENNWEVQKLTYLDLIIRLAGSRAE